MRARALATLSAFEVMWPDYYDIVAGSGSDRRPLAQGHHAYILIEAMGYNQELDQQVFAAFLESAFTEGLVVDAVVAASDKQIADLWRVREAAECIVRDMSPFVSSDVSLDVRDVSRFVDLVRLRLSERYATVRTATFGHLGDNNIHLALHVGANTLAEELNVERIMFDTLRTFGGALTAEHGIGQLKREFLPGHKHPGEMAVMRAVRNALDPDGLLNSDVLF
jgi:FAD/FMN-containing dehydrogenase